MNKLKELLEAANATSHNAALSQCETLIIEKYPNLQHTKELLNDCVNFCLTKANDTNRSVEQIVASLVVEE